MDHRVETRNTSDNSPQPRVENIGRSGPRFLSDWKCWALTVLSLLTLVLLFQPWLTAVGPYGDVRTDAFGELDGSVPALGVGERMTDGVASVSGVWGLLAAVTAVITLVGTCLYWMFGVGLSAVVGAGAVHAVLVPGVLLYLDGKASELRAMTEQHDELKSALGDIVGNLFGGGWGSGAGATPEAATVAMTNQALICGVAAVLTGMIALSMRNSIRYTGDTHVLAELSLQTPDIEVPAAEVPVGGGRPEGPAGGTVLKYRIDVELPYELRVLGAARPVDEDELETGAHRLLARTESPRRTDGQVGTVRRDRPTARRPRPRPTNRTSATAQSGIGSGASAKRAAGPCKTARPARQAASV